MVARIFSLFLIGTIAASATQAFANNHLTEGVLIGEAIELLDSTRVACSGISDELSHISGISVANTAVSGAGTVAAGGALAAGVKKSKTDKEIADILARMCELGSCDPNELENMSDEEFAARVMGPLVQAIEQVYADEISRLSVLRNQQKEKTQQSKKLGNWRTALLAGTTATNITSAILAGLNRNQSDLIQHITVCNTLTGQLRDKMSQLQQAGVSPLDNPIFSDASQTIDTCGGINIADIEKIERRMTAVMGTSVAGATIGAVGTGVSAAANSKKIRDDNSDDGKKKEANLNKTANVMAGANIATGAVETGLNISLITLTKKLIKNAQACENVL